MPEIHHPFYPQVLYSVFISIVFFFAFDLSGRFFCSFFQSDNEKSEGSLDISPFIGICIAVCIFSLFYFKLQTTQVLVFISVIFSIFYFSDNKNTFKWSSINFRLKNYFYEFFVFVFLIFYRFYQLLDKDYVELNTENCDQYNYLDNLNWMEMFRSENSFLELESKYFGFKYKFMNYHFFEYNLGIMMKKFFPFNNYEFFQLCLQPFILGIALICLIRVLSGYFRQSYLFVLFLVMAFFLIHRANYIHFIVLSPLKSIIDLNLFKEFPFYAISDPYFLYASSFIPKISVFILGLSGFLFSIFNRNPALRIISNAFLFSANISYFPLIFIYEFLDFLIMRKKNYAFVGFSAFLLISLFGYTYYSNFSSETIGKGIFVNMYFSLSPKDFYYSMNKEILFLLGNFYSIFIYLGILIFVIKPRSLMSIFFLILIFLFPFCFINYEWFGKLFLILVFAFSIAYFKIIFQFLISNHMIFKILISFIFILLILQFSKFILEAFQIGYNAFAVLASFLPVFFILYILKNSRMSIGIFVVSFIFIVHNVFSGIFYFNRIFFPGTSKNFAHEFYSKVSGKKKINTVYFTRFSEIPYFYVDKPSFNLQNYSDSIFSTCVSFHLLTQKDTNEIKKRNSWDKFMSFPFSQFVNSEGKNLNRESQIRKFMEKIDCKAVFVRDNAKDLAPDFFRELSSDSLYCRQFGYTAYILKDGWARY